jgi:chromosome segregation ATPase
MSDVDAQTISPEVEAWAENVLSACNLKWNGPTKGFEREPKENLRIDGKTPVADHINYLRKTLNTIYDRRSEIAGKAKLDRDLAVHLQYFDQAYVAVDSNIDKAQASMGSGDAGGALSDAVDQLEFMRDALEAAYYSAAKDPEEAYAELRAKIDTAKAELDELGKEKDKIQDENAREEFEDIYSEARDGLDQSLKTLEADKFLEAEEELEEAKAVMLDLRPGNSEDIAKRKKEYQAVAEDAKKNIKNLSSKLSTLSDQEKVKDFNKHKTSANNLIKKVETALKNGKVKSVRSDIPKLKGEVEKMKACFKVEPKAKAPPKAKPGKK